MFLECYLDKKVKKQYMKYMLLKDLSVFTKLLTVVTTGKGSDLEKGLLIREDFYFLFHILIHLFIK